MLEIHAKDYFSLKYDAAAKNKVSSLRGATYLRDYEEQTQSLNISAVRLYSTGEEVQLPYGPLVCPYDYGSFFIEKEVNGFAVASITDSVLDDSRYMEAQVRFGQYLKSMSNSIDKPTVQLITIGTFEVTFTDLNLPEGVLPEISLSYDMQHFATAHRHVNYEDLRSQAFTINAFRSRGLSEGRYFGESWESLWIGGGLKALDPSEDYIFNFEEEIEGIRLLEEQYAISFDTQLSQTGIVYAPMGYIFQSKDGDFRLGYVSEELFTYDDYILSERNFSDQLSVISSEGTPPSALGHFKGGYFNLVKVQGDLLNRDTFKVTVELPIHNAIAGYDNDRYPETSLLNEYQHITVCEWLKGVRVQIKYAQMKWTEQPFTIQSDSATDLYPYKFTGARAANMRDSVGGVLWADYYPKLIFNKYQEGKHYVELKVRTKFMLENGVTIDTPVQIYDLKNKPISRNGVPCTFKVKRIIKSFSNNEFYYIISCLED